jgi:hypothetical protein
MARKPRAKKGNEAIEGILAALKFCEPASKEVGQVNQTHLRLANNWAIAFDGVVAIGHKIDSDITTNPHTRTLIKALEKCTDATQITQLGDGRLSIQSGKFRAFVPCLTDELLGNVTPDSPCAHINPAVFNSLRIVAPIAKENAERIMLASVLLRSGSAVATDGKIMMESWHGVDLPPCIVPKSFVNIIAKIEKPPIHFGFSPSSATFYFDDGSWIRTQLYTERWPDVDKVLNMQNTQWAIPGGFWEGIAKIADLSDENRHVYFGDKMVRTAPVGDEHGAMCEVDGALPPNLCFNIDHLLMIGDKATSVDFLGGPTQQTGIFYGNNFRAFVSQINRASNGKH